MPNSEEQHLWYALLSHPPIKLNRLKPLVFDWTLNEKKPLSALFSLPAEELQARYSLTSTEMEKWAEILRLLPDDRQQWSALNNQGLEMASRADEVYPEPWKQRLPLEQAPMLIYFRGNAGLLQEPGVIFCGDSLVSGNGDRGLAELAMTFAQEGLNVIGGSDDAVAGAALRTALAAGGPAILLLSQGLGTFDATEFADPLAEERLLLISPFAPGVAAQPEHAAAVSRLAHALASMLIAYAPQPQGAAWEQICQSLAEDVPVFIEGHENPGISLDPLWQKGALPLQRETDFSQLLESLYLDRADRKAAPHEALPADSPIDGGLNLDESAPLLPGEALSALQQWGKVPEKLQRRLAER
jgi:predicted Rossmann fold nucleotide-binding protein DprA/Smf involved in DNA uptake